MSFKKNSSSEKTPAAPISPVTFFLQAEGAYYVPMCRNADGTLARLGEMNMLASALLKLTTEMKKRIHHPTKEV